MNIARNLCLASILALSFAAPVQAQNPKEGDYYAPAQPRRYMRPLAK